MTTFYFFPILPRTYRIISKYYLIGMIVFLLAISEVGSFIGISYRASTSAHPNPSSSRAPSFTPFNINAVR